MQYKKKGNKKLPLNIHPTDLNYNCDKYLCARSIYSLSG